MRNKIFKFLKVLTITTIVLGGAILACVSIYCICDNLDKHEYIKSILWGCLMIFDISIGIYRITD